MELDTVILGDCLEVLKLYPAESIDLVVTSPPYCDRRNRTYGGIQSDEYVEWFLPIARELYRVLKPSGSFVLNIKEHVENGERHTYVMEMILCVRAMGWRYTEEYIWCKTKCMPGRWPTRLRDAWERCIHFTKSKNFAMYQEAVLVPAAPATLLRGEHLSESDCERQESAVQSGFGRNMRQCTGRTMVLPSNVLHIASESNNRNHSAAFPEKLPRFFIDLFSREGDVVLDPFSGSGTTCAVAAKVGRRFLGIEKQPDYHAASLARLNLTHDDLIVDGLPANHRNGADTPLLIV